MFNPDALSSNIKKYRLQLNLTQQDLAQRLFVSAQAVSKWESGQSQPDLANLTALAKVFGISVDTLLDSNDRKVRMFLGIDGGATKTEFVLVQQDGKVLFKLVLAGSNPNVCGMEETCRILKSGVDTMLARFHRIDGVFAGVAGSMSGDNLQNINTFLQSEYPFLSITCSSDICNVIYGAGDFEKCAAMICGTGFVIYANTHDGLQRVGGWGYLLDSASGGFSLGREALRAALAQEDGFGTETLLTKLVEDKLGKSVWSSISEIYAGGDSLIASFAPLVLTAYGEGDSVAENILCSFAKEMARLLDYTLDAYDCQNTVVVSGGLMRKDLPLIGILKAQLQHKAKIIVPETPPVYGACVRACKLYGQMNDTFRENFQNTYSTKSED